MLLVEKLFDTTTDSQNRLLTEVRYDNGGDCVELEVYSIDGKCFLNHIMYINHIIINMYLYVDCFF